MITKAKTKERKKFEDEINSLILIGYCFRRKENETIVFFQRKYGNKFLNGWAVYNKRFNVKKPTRTDVREFMISAGQIVY